MDVAIAGGNGFVGHHLVPALLDVGHSVKVLDLEPYDGPRTEDVETVEADLTDSETFSEALEDVDVVYYLVHSMAASSDFLRIERQCAKNMRDVCSKRHVERIVYLTGIVPDGELSEHLSSRKQVADLLADGNADVTELRAAIVLGKDSASFRMMRQLVERLPVMVAPAWLESNCQPIYIDDVIYYLEHVLDHDQTRGTYYDIGGPDIETYRRLLRILGEEHLGRPIFLPVPLLTPRLSSYWLGLVTDLPTSLGRALVESLREDMVVEKPIDDIISHDCVGYRDAVKQILEESG